MTAGWFEYRKKFLAFFGALREAFFVTFRKALNI